MKNTLRASSLLLAFLLLSFCFVSCGYDKVLIGGDPLSRDQVDPWADALYTADTTLGEGAKTVTVQVTAYEKTVVFTIKTDAQYLGQALLDNKLVEGEMGAYGLYIKRVNGILADYDIDGTYWAFYSNGEYMMSGVDTTEISGGEHYELVREQ